MATERLISILVKAQDEASKVLQDVGKNASGASGGLEIAKKGLIAVGAAAATAAVATAAFAVKSFNDFRELGDELSKMSVKTGVAVESLSRLKYAGDLSDVSMDQLATGLKKLNINTASALEGNEGMIDSFKRIGLSMDQVKQMNTEQLFIKISDAIRGTKDPVEQSKIAFELLGKQGQEMLPLLTSDIGAAADEASRLGLVMSTEAAQASEAFNDNLTRVQKGLSSVGVSIANELLPILAPMLEKVVEATQRFADWMREMGGIVGIKNMVVSSVQEMIGKFDQKTKIITHLKSVWADISKFFMEQIKPSLDKLLEAIKPFLPVLEFMAKLVGTVLVVAFHILLELIKGAVLIVFAMLKAAMDTLTAVLNGLVAAWNWLIDKFKSVIEWGQKVVDMFNRIISAAKEAMKYVGGGISNAVSSVKSGLSSVGSALGFADGGIVTKPTLAMIGEAGESEAVIPLSQLPSLLGFGGQQAAAAGNITVNVNGGYYLDQNAAEDFGNILLNKLKNKFIL